MIPFSIVVPTFNRAELLDPLLGALLAQSAHRVVQILVCDSGSADGTAEVVARRAAERPGAVDHLQVVNSVSVKRNAGLMAARHDHVIFLDDDCIPWPDFLATYDRYAYMRMGGGAKVMLCGETRFPAEWGTGSNYYRFRDERHFSHDAALAEIPLDFKTIVTMNMCVRRETFLRDVGGFDESFIGYGAEDQELGWRVQKAGFALQACPAGAEHREMSRDVRVFGDKLRRTGRDGALTLLQVAPEAATSIKLARMLEPDFPNRGPIDVLAHAAICVILALRLHEFLASVLIATDKVRPLYFPLGYRIYMACCYALGVGQRGRRLSAEEAASGWVGATR